ncbi:MAG: hypothetical protein ACRD1V_04810, partial [Vicinamibacterales bacterium]
MRRFALPLAIALVLPAAAAAHGDKEKHPSISLKANPAMAFSPAHVVLTADLKGGENDDEA